MNKNALALGAGVIAICFAVAGYCAPFAYIADDGASRVTVIDTATNLIVTNITGVGSVPEGVAVNAAGTRVYVTNSVASGTVAVIDAATNTVVATIPVGNAPFGIAVNAVGTRVYVANFGS
jgi:YVTN family beta-propeller protein